MKILVITYYYGSFASGIVSERVVNALAANGHEVYVVSSSDYKSQNDRVIYYPVENIIKDNSFIHRFLRVIYDCFGVKNNIFWERRAYSVSMKICKKFTPDWIYCRSTPLDACVVGEWIRKKTNIKVLQHFTDPIPSPLISNLKERKRLLDMTDPIIKNADLVSFGNQEMLNYSSEIRHYSFLDKSFVSPDPASSSDIRVSALNHNELISFLYLGNIIDVRNPIPLLNALKKIREHHNLKLFISSARPVLKKNDLSVNYDFVEYTGITKNVDSAIDNSDYLVDLDVDFGVPVFISSKLKDYLRSTRPILSISPSNSPSTRLLYGFKTVYSCINDEEMLFETISRMLKEQLLEEDYFERKRVVEQFSPVSVTKEIINKMNNYNN